MKLNRLLIGFGAVAAAGIAAAGILSHKAEVTNTVEVTAASAGDTLYVKLNSEWAGLAGESRFEAYFFGNGDTWATMWAVNGQADTYGCEVPAGGYTSVIFTRCNPNGTEHNWNSKWNQSADLTLSSGDYCILSSGWGSDNNNKPSGTWKTVGGKSVYVQGDFTGWAADEDYKLTWNPANIQYEATGLSLPKDGKFKIVDDGAWKGYQNAENQDSALFDHDGEGDANIILKTETSYDIYYKPLTGKFWMEENAQIAAENYATKFLNTFTCTGTSPGAVTAASTVWTSEGGTIAEAFWAMSIGAKGKITTATASRTGNVIERCLDRYRFVIEKYGTAVYKDFMDLYPDGYDPAGRILSPNKNAGGTSGLVLGILGGISVVSAGVLLILRKRKIA